MNNTAMNNVVEQCKKHLVEYYGDRFKSLIVYGSVARNEATAASDIDLLVLLHLPFDYFQELKAIVALLYPIQLESDYLISARPAGVEEFEQGTLQLYRNIRREGISV